MEISDAYLKTLSVPQMTEIIRVLKDNKKSKKKWVTSQEALNLRKLKKELRVANRAPPKTASIRDIMTGKPHANDFLQY